MRSSNGLSAMSSSSGQPRKMMTRLFLMAVAAVGAGRRATHSFNSERSPSSSQQKEALSTRSWWSLVKQTFRDWTDDKAPRLGAALAYYSIFSLAPLLVICLAVAGLFFDGDRLYAELDS